MSDDPDSYFKNAQVVSFDIIRHECRGDELKGTYKDLWVKRDLIIKNFKDNFN